MPAWSTADAVTMLALAVAVLAVALLAWLVLLLRRRGRSESGADPVIERLERGLRDELQRQGQGTRGDLATFQRLLMTQGGESARTQSEQLDAFRDQLAAMQQRSEAALRRAGDALAEQLQQRAEADERRQAALRTTVEARLAALQDGNERKLEQMRATVDEKLHATLEQRLGESFRQVAERLEQVHRGLGEMQGLARDVGSLNRVLNNVKTRGIFGEIQLAGLLEQVFTVEQYATNVATVPDSRDRVEFAIRLPGHGGRGADAAPLWLPIDAKFPREDYERLLDAHERADGPAMETAAAALDARLRLEARRIRDKYLAPPHTTDFAILFLPTEGLYAEALRRPGLVESLQRECKVMVAGPTTLLATLNSLQMGFRTLALERRSAEVWEVLGAVKTEFGRFGAILDKTRRKLAEASHTIDDAAVRTRAMERQLRRVEALPEHRSAELLPGLPSSPSDGAAGAAGADGGAGVDEADGVDRVDRVEPVGSDSARGIARRTARDADAVRDIERDRPRNFTQDGAGSAALDASRDATVDAASHAPPRAAPHAMPIAAAAAAFDPPIGAAPTPGTGLPSPSPSPIAAVPGG